MGGEEGHLWCSKGSMKLFKRQFEGAERFSFGFHFTPFPINVTERPRYSIIIVLVSSYIKLDSLSHAQRNFMIIGDLNICPTRVYRTEKMKFPGNREWNR